MTKQTFDIFLAINESGDYTISVEDEATALEELRDSWGAEAYRVVRLVVSMSLPKVTDVPVNVPDESVNNDNITVGVS